MASSAHEPGIEAEGSASPLVLVPGLDGTGLLFYRQVPLLERRFRVATYALRDDRASMADLVDDLAGALEIAHPGEGPAIVVGESFGGALAMSFALRFPERVARLVLVNSFAYFRPQWLLAGAVGALRLLPWGAMRLVRRLTALRLHSDHTHRREIRRFLELTAQTTKEGYLGRLRMLREYDVRDQLADIRCPVLFVAADEDRLVPAVEQARYMAQRVQQGTLRILPGHGHICLIAPDVDLDRIIADWQRDRIPVTQDSLVAPLGRPATGG